MIVRALIPLVVLGAPEDAAKLLRVAWASQYEWRESGVSNATLDFEYSYRWKGAKEGQAAWQYEGRGQVVVAGTGIVRRHYPGASESRRKQIGSHVDWVVGRFVRRPFEEEFKESVIEGPESAGDGLLRISVAPREAPTTKRYLLIKDGRLVGREWRLGGPESPTFNRLTYTIGDMGDGYAVLGEDVTWARKESETTTTRRLACTQGKEFPFPKSYTYRLTTSMGTSEVRLDFTAPRVNAKHPVLGNPAARDALKAGWERRYVLPNEIRIEGSFHRRVDKNLAKLGWMGTVKGELQVWGMDKVDVMLDERLFPDQSWTGEISRLCHEHFRQLFGWMHDKPFDKAFEDCGFEFVDEGEGTVTVLVFGYEKLLGFVLEEGRVVGYQPNGSAENPWWRFRLKKVNDDKVRIESMSAKLDGKSVTLRIKYMRRKGVQVPKSFEVLGGPRRWSKSKEGHGVAAYSLKKVKVSFPD